MPLQVSYMGTKRLIAPKVAKIISRGPDGPLLDLFSGVCAIASEVSPDRQIWCNDVQHFASAVGGAFFTSAEPPTLSDHAAEVALPYYRSNQSALERRYSYELAAETDAINSRHFARISELENCLPNVAISPGLERERADLARRTQDTPYRLFSISYAGTYLGLRQCIDVDSIRYAIDRLKNNDSIHDEQHRWLCLALCQALSKVSTTTGHFAQYMRVKEDTLRRFLAQRTRSVWREWLAAIYDLSPIGSKTWRLKNRVFRKYAIELINDLASDTDHPAIIYADPPYTSDHYSRYYHLYETLLLYDYPSSQGIGRYRPDRFISPFSIKTKVKAALNDLISSCATIGCRFVLSYPANGLLQDSENEILSMLKRHFGKGRVAARFDHYHSSMGGSKGRQKYQVKELIFSAG